MNINIVIELFEKVGIPVLTAAAAGYGLWWLIRWITGTFRQDVLKAIKELHKEMDEEIAKIVEDEIVEFPICYKCGRETDSINDYLYCPECESKEENK